MKSGVLAYVVPVLIVNLGNACAYAFQIVIARTLTKADVGAFNALLSSVTLLAAPASIAPVAITRLALRQQQAQQEAGIGPVVARTTLFALAASILVGIAMFVTGPWLGAFLKIPSAETMALFAALLAVTLIFPVPAGWFQGLGRNIEMALVQGGMPILRFFFGALFLAGFGMGLNGAVMASALPCIVVFALGLAVLWPGRAAFSTALAPGLARDTLRFVLPAACSASLIYALFNLDMVLARSLLPADESGLYAMAAVIGRIPFLLPAALAGIFFADLARANPDDRAALNRLLIRFFGIVGGVAFGLAVVIALAAEPLLSLMAGPSYLAAAPVLRISAFAMALLSLLNLAVTLSQARDDHRALWILLVGVCVFAALTFNFATAAVDIVRYLSAAMSVMVVVCVVLLFQKPTSQQSRVGTALR